MKDIKDQIDQWSDLLPTNNSINQLEAERRATVFLQAMAHIANWRHLLTDEKIKLESVRTSVYHEQMSRADSKMITEKKSIAEASKEYISSREDFESIDNDLSYLKTYYDIFFNAHIFYRQISKQETL